MRLGGIRAGDLVQCDVKGRRFHAQVTACDDSGLAIRPLERAVTYRHVRTRQVVALAQSREVQPTPCRASGRPTSQGGHRTMSARTRRSRIVTAATRRLVIHAVLAAAPVALLLGVGDTPAATASPPASSPLQVIAEPQAGVAPFLAMIRGAHTSVDLTMYELFDRQIEQALAADATRAVDVRVVLNGSYYSHHENTNAPAFHYLSARGVHVHYSPTYLALTHQKTLTVDGRESAIMTLNFDGLYSSTRDYAVIDSQLADVAAITATFDADYAGHRLAASTGTGDLVWSPGAAPTVLGMINAARRSIDLEDEEMAYAPATAALCDAATRGVTVHVVMTYASEWRSAFARVEHCGVTVDLYHGQRYYIHAKLLIVDGRRALVSSQNLSTGSLQYNRELGIEVTDAAAVGGLRRDFATDDAAAS